MFRNLIFLFPMGAGLALFPGIAIGYFLPHNVILTNSLIAMGWGSGMVLIFLMAVILWSYYS